MDAAVSGMLITSRAEDVVVVGGGGAGMEGGRRQVRRPVKRSSGQAKL